MSQYAITSPKIHKERLKYPSIQRKLYRAWEDCLDARKQKTHLLFLNGEPVDGPGEIDKGTELWSTEIKDGIDDAYELLKMYEPTKFMATRGSNYHSNARTIPTEELIMDKFGDKSVPYNPYENIGEIKVEGHRRTYNFAWLDVNGLLLCVAHHISGSKWFSYYPTAIGREMAALTFELDKWLPKQYQGRDFIVVKSHQHRFVEVRYSSSAGFVTPAWKLPDWFLQRGGLGGTLPSIGTVEVIVEPNGEYAIHPHITKAKKYPKVQVLKI